MSTISINNISKTRVHLKSEVGMGDSVLSLSDILNSKDIRSAATHASNYDQFYKRILRSLVVKAFNLHSSRVTDIDSVTLKQACGAL